ncbi:MAG: DUF3347 domain-containing protein [Opitutae bacterium]|nr:DUF3347 domain-containing protein [Opitutae bacterium]
MKTHHILIVAALSLLGAATGLHAADAMPGHAHASALTDAQKQFLSGYEAVRAALAADDLAAAKTAAAALAGSPAAAALTKAQSLDAARGSFKKLSSQAVQLANGQRGYHVAYCPMADSDWVQTTKTIGNPYLGRQMSACGDIKN